MTVGGVVLPTVAPTTDSNSSFKIFTVRSSDVVSCMLLTSVFVVFFEVVAALAVVSP